MDKTNALQNLLRGKASQEEIELLKELLARGEISIGGNVSSSVIIQGSENNVQFFQLTPEMLALLGGHNLLGNLERDLSGEEIALGLQRLETELTLRAPVLASHFQEQAHRLRPSLKTDPNALSESAHKERLEALAHINSLCMEVLDISFNAIAIGEELPEYEARCPFRGLESFRVEDHEFFFGREELTKRLLRKIKTHSFLAVLGASGSGKSSLVMAGIIPALNLDYTIIRPGTNPLAALESARGKSIIVVDQFEELFTLTRDEKTRADFIVDLLDSAKSGRVIITLRSDFLGEVGTYRSLSGEIQNHLEIVPPMNADELCRAMEGQARWARLEFEADLSQQILDDVAGEPGAMPLLQHALWELWNHRHGRHLRASEYRAFGGVKQAITNTAEKVYSECTKPEQEQLRVIFLRLTRLDDCDEERDTRRRVPLGDLISASADAFSISALLDKLANARLIVKTFNDDKTEIEVAHEALIRHWERLRTWLNDDRDSLRLREDVTENAHRWENTNRDESLLSHRGPHLELALALSKNPRYHLNPVEQSYLDGCVELREREKLATAKRRQYTITGISTALMLIIAILAGWGWTSNENSKQLGYQIATATYAQGLAQQQAATADGAKATAVAEANFRATAQVEAENQRNLALARQLAAQSQLISQDSGALISSGLLAVESAKLGAGFQADQSLRRYINLVGYLESTYPFLGSVSSIAISPDLQYVVLGYNDGLVVVGDLTTEKIVLRMAHDDAVQSVALSSDGKFVVTGSEDETTRVWEIATGKEVVRMNYDGAVHSVAFSSDGKYVVSGGCYNFALPNCLGGIVQVWDPTTGKEIARIQNGGEIYSVAFSSDSRYVASGNSDGYACVWEVATGEKTACMLHGLGTSVFSVAFSPDGKYVISGGEDHKAIIWEAYTGKEISHVIHDGAVRTVSFSSSGKHIITGSDDHTARVWRTTGKEIARVAHDSEVYFVSFTERGSVSWSVDNNLQVWVPITGKDVVDVMHDDNVRSVAFSPDGEYFATCSYDSTARIWETATGKEVARLPHEGRVYSVAFSPNGEYLVTGSEDGTARVWDATSGQEIAQMSHGDRVYSVAFSPDGKYVVSGSADHTARVWESITGKEIARMTHDAWLDVVAFSQDGKYVVSSGGDNTARVWEATTGNEVARMTHDEAVRSVAFSPDCKLIVSRSDDGHFRIWEATTGKEVAHMTLDIKIDASNEHDAYPDIFNGGDRTVLVWKEKGFTDYANISTFGSSGENAAVNALVFSPDGRYVASSGGDNTARIWEAITGQEVARIIHESKVYSVAFSPDGEYLVTGGADGTVRVWNVYNGQEIARMNHNDIVNSAVFSPDGKYVVSGSADYTARVWYWHIEDLIDETCNRLPRNLTRAEWSQYIGDTLPYQAVCPNLPLEPESTPTP